jgi:hypothetical protein
MNKRPWLKRDQMSLSEELRELARLVDHGYAVSYHDMRKRLYSHLPPIHHDLPNELIIHICSFLLLPKTTLANQVHNLKIRLSLMAFCGKQVYKDLQLTTWKDVKFLNMQVNVMWSIIDACSKRNGFPDICTIFFLKKKTTLGFVFVKLVDAITMVCDALSNMEKLLECDKMTFHNTVLISEWRYSHMPYGRYTYMLATKKMSRTTPLLYYCRRPFAVCMHSSAA